MLTACVSPQQQQAPEQTVETRSRVEQIQTLLVDAHSALSPEKERMQLQASHLLIEERQLEFARQILESIDTSTLDNMLYASYLSLNSQLDVLQGNYQVAIDNLQSPRLLAAYDQLSLQDQLEIREIRASAYTRLGEHYASAKERVFIDDMLSNELKDSNRNAIWRSQKFTVQRGCSRRNRLRPQPSRRRLRQVCR